MIHIPVTLFTAGILGLLCLLLSILVSAARRQTKTLIGDGANAPGTETLVRAIRAQGNFIEYVPIALILLAGIEVSGASHLTCEIFAALLILGRILHAIGINQAGANSRRAAGALLTWLALFGLSLEALRLLL